MRYEISLIISTDKRLWIYGGYPCGRYTDIMLAREAFTSYLNDDEKTIADRGYRDRHFIIPNDVHGNDVKILHQRIRARHETVNQRLKDFKCLATKFLNSHVYFFQYCPVNAW